MTTLFDTHRWVNHGDPGDGDVTCGDCGSPPNAHAGDHRCPAAEYVRPPKAAEMLGVTRQAVYQLIERGRLPCVTPYPRYRLIPKHAVEARIASR